MRPPCRTLAIASLLIASLSGCRVMNAPPFLNMEEEATYHLIYAEKMVLKCELEQSYRVKLNDLVAAAITAGDALAPMESIPRIEKLVDANVKRALADKKWACAELSAWLVVTHNEVSESIRK